MRSALAGLFTYQGPWLGHPRGWLETRLLIDQLDRIDSPGCPAALPHATIGRGKHGNRQTRRACHYFGFVQGPGPWGWVMPRAGQGVGGDGNSVGAHIRNQKQGSQRPEHRRCEIVSKGKLKGQSLPPLLAARVGCLLSRLWQAVVDFFCALPTRCAGRNFIVHGYGRATVTAIILGAHPPQLARTLLQEV
jgi:hypothetical protein